MINDKTFSAKKFIESHGVRAIALHSNSIMCICNDSEGIEHVEVIDGTIQSARDYLGY